MPLFIITLYLTASAREVPDARSHSPTYSSQVLKPDSNHSGWSHQCFASNMIFCINGHTILGIWKTSPVSQTPCLCSVGLFNRSDEGSDTSFRDQCQYATLQVCFAKRFHSCHGDRMCFNFAIAHQRLGNSTRETHVDSESEAEILIICIVSTERRRLHQACQVLEQVCIKRFRHNEAILASSRIGGFNEPAPLPCKKTR